jgi:hypothetical protein
MNEEWMMLGLRCAAGAWCVWLLWLVYKAFSGPQPPPGSGEQDELSKPKGLGDN